MGFSHPGSFVLGFISFNIVQPELRDRGKARPELALHSVSTKCVPTPQGTGKSAKEILRRIDYLGSSSLMMAVRSYALLISYTSRTHLGIIIRLALPSCFSVLATTKRFPFVTLPLLSICDCHQLLYLLTVV